MTTTVLGRARAYVDACHPGPTATVTLVITVVAIAAGRDWHGVILVACAVLAGQLSIGWSNDARDADRDLHAGRSEKPTVRGAISSSTLWHAAFIALVLSITLSYAASGAIGGTAHVISVLSAWAYNLALKTTVFSALPYAVSFGLVPAFVTFGLTPPGAPATWVSMACALMGVGAHLANALPDVESDRAVSAGGLVAAIGVRASTLASLACLLGAVTLLVAHLNAPVAIQVLVIVVVVVAAGVVATFGRGRALFRFTMALALVDVVLLVLTAARITA